VSGVLAVDLRTNTTMTGAGCVLFIDTGLSYI
jgi:hypothetical protein